MSAHTNNHIVYMAPTMSHRDVVVQRPTGTSRPSGLEALIAAGVRYLVSFPRRQAVKHELQRLTDRELADIGLSRAEISTVFTRPR